MTVAQQQYTVGDTFTVVHRVAVPVGSVVQPRHLADSTLVTLLGAPTVSREGDSVRIAYGVAVWAPGRNELVIPGVVVVRPDGRIDTLPDARVMLDVASVLPAGEPVSSLPPRAARPWVSAGDRSWLPFAILAPIAIAVLVAAWWWRRRRGPTPVPPVRQPSPRIDADRLQAWHDAGEDPLVIDQLLHAFNGVPDAADWSERVATTRFAPGQGAERIALVREGLQLLRELRS